MIDFFIKVKQQESQNLPFVLYKKPDNIKVVGIFRKMTTYILLKILRKLVLFLLLL